MPPGEKFHCNVPSRKPRVASRANYSANEYYITRAGALENTIVSTV
jgi:hypothetical protein